MQSLFALPLRPDAYRATTAGRLRIEVELLSSHELSNSKTVSKQYPLTITERTRNRLKADFSGERVGLTEDFAIKYTLDPAKKDTLAILAYRDSASEPGFFEASALIGDTAAQMSGAPADDRGALRHLSIDAMGEVGAELYGAREIAPQLFARSIGFICCYSIPKLLRSRPSRQAPSRRQGARLCRGSRLRGGTDMQKALSAAVPLTKSRDSYMVLFTDGSPHEARRSEARRLHPGTRTRRELAHMFSR